MDEVAKFLAGSVVCKDFDGVEVEEIAKIAKSMQFQTGDVIVAEDARGRDLYFIKSGRVQITLSGPSIKEDAGTITKCLPGQVFGELGFIDGARRSTWVVAIDEVEAVKLSWDDFAKLTQSNMTIAYKFMYNLALVIAERLRDTTMSLSNVLGVRG
ncbi:MAG: cyclic nucleotide-binding domain-containing protein [Syntrophobacterales bacterium]|jgi:CRP-like cAMP-binding protein